MKKTKRKKGEFGPPGSGHPLTCKTIWEEFWKTKGSMNDNKASSKPATTGPYWMQSEMDTEAKLMFWYSETEEYRLLGTEKLRSLPDDGIEFRYRAVESINLFPKKRIKPMLLFEFLTMEKPRFLFLSGELNERVSTDTDRWYRLYMDGWYYCELNWNRLPQGISVFYGERLLGKIFWHSTLDDLGLLVDPWIQKLKEEQKKIEKTLERKESCQS